jgi:hypothetical protein
VAAHHCQDAEGEKTAREAVGQESFLLDGSRGEQTLEGSERLREGFPEEPILFRNPEEAKTSEAGASQGQRGSGEPNKAASYFGKYSLRT